MEEHNPACLFGLAGWVLRPATIGETALWPDVLDVLDEH